MAEANNLIIGLLAASGILSLFVFVTGGTLGILSAIPLLIAIIAAPLSFLLYKWGYWLVPYVTRGQRVIQSDDAIVEIPHTEDVVVKKVGDYYYASMYVVVKIFKSVTNMTDEEKFGFMELWERTVSALKPVTKYAVLVYLKDLYKYKESIEARKAKAQMEIAKENEKPNPDKQRLDLLMREISMWDGILSRLDVGDKPTAILTYIQTTAKGMTKDAAMAAARQNVNEIRTAIGTALNVEIAPLSGEDMKRCFDWEYTLPRGTKGL